MAASEPKAPSKSPEFIVHIFIHHDPIVSSVFLPDLFSDFPISKWKLPKLLLNPDDGSSLASTNIRRQELLLHETVGRYVLPVAVPATTKLENLIVPFCKLNDFDSKHLAQFTLLPHSEKLLVQHSSWNDKPLPWNLTLAEVAAAYHDATHRYSALREIPAQKAPVLHLVLETKAGALSRVTGKSYGLGEPFASRLQHKLHNMSTPCDSFWHFLCSEPLTDLKSTFEKYGLAKSMIDELEKGKWEGDFWSENGLVQTMHDIEHAKGALRACTSNHIEYEIEHEIYSLRRKVQKMEEAINRGKEMKKTLDYYIHLWRHWVIRHNYSNSESRELAHEELGDAVKLITQQMELKAKEWREYEDQKGLEGVFRNDFY